MQKVIDVSDNQGVIDWCEVSAAGVKKAILRSVRRSGNPDNEFFRNLKGCRQNGIEVEVYKYTYAVSIEQAEEEAMQVTALLRQAGVSCFIWWDVESREVLVPLGRQVLTACIQAAREVIEGAGYEFGIYTGFSFYRAGYFDAESFDCPYWIARYPSRKIMPLQEEPPEEKKPEIGTQTLRGWQYTSHGRVDGIKGRVDLSQTYEEEKEKNSLAEFIKGIIHKILNLFLH